MNVMEREKKTCKSKKCGNWWRPEQQAPKKESDFIDELSVIKGNYNRFLG